MTLLLFLLLLLLFLRLHTRLRDLGIEKGDQDRERSHQGEEWAIFVEPRCQRREIRGWVKREDRRSAMEMKRDEF